MESKFIIFVVSVCLAQYSSALSSTPTYGLSERGSFILNEIQKNQDAAFFAHRKGLNKIFDQLEKLAAQSIYELISPTEEDVSAIAEALAAAKEATNYYSESIALIAPQGNSGFDFQTVQDILYAILDDVYAVVPKAIFAAQGENYSEARAEIETLQAVVKEDLESLVENIFNPVRNCLNTIDANKLAVIENAQNRSSTGLAHTANAVFNAIKIYGAANDGKKQVKNVLNVMKKFRNEALIGSGTYVESQFTVLKALLIADELNQSEIVQCLAVDQRAHTTIKYKSTKALEFLWDLITYAARRFETGVSDDDEDDFSTLVAVRAELSARFNALTSAVLIPSSCMRPVFDYGVTVAEKELFLVTDAIANTYLNAIQVAQDQEINLPEAQAKIVNYLETLLSDAGDYVNIFLDVMGNGQKWDDDTAAKIASYQAAAEGAIEIIMDSVLGTSITLAHTFHGIVTDVEDNLFAIQTNKRRAFAAIPAFANALSSINVAILVAANKDQ